METKIGFPPPLLGGEPQRLILLGQGDGWLALEKPVGCCSDAHPFYPDAPSTVAAVNVQSSKCKPELERLGIKKVFEVYPMEPELAGVLFLANGAEGRTAFRNAMGSYQFDFTFQLIAKDVQTRQGDERVCSLPIARHSEKNIMLISHKTGKKARTIFSKLMELKNGYSLWEARTDYLRLHQLRLHAFESGLCLPGEAIYRDEIQPEHPQSKAIDAGFVPAFLKSVVIVTHNIKLDCPVPMAISRFLKHIAMQ